MKTLFVFFASLFAVLATEATTQLFDHDKKEKETLSETDDNVILTSGKSKKRVILVLGAANGWTNWTLVESYSESPNDWSIEEGDMDGFGGIMKEEGFQAALDRFQPQLTKVLKVLRPDALLVRSKGLNVLTFLVSRGLWNGPSILVSPIPNVCDHVVRHVVGPVDDGTVVTREDVEGSWNLQWTASLGVLRSENVGPVAVGVGTSFDEQMLIVDMMEESGICGVKRTECDADANRRTDETCDVAEASSKRKQKTWFEDCPGWSLYSFPGDHSWASDVENAPNVAFLIDEVIKS